MNAAGYAMRCGVRRGRIEFMNSVRAGQDIAYYVIVSVVLLVVLWLNRNGTVPGTDVSVAAFMLPGLLALQIAFFVPGLMADGFWAALGAVGYLILGLFAVLPLGFIIGSVFKNPRSVGGWGMLVMGAVVWVSGIFSPLATMATWVQILGQLTPTYWLGLGLRSTLLPESAVVAEIGGSWRTLLTIGVLLIWAIGGLILAPMLLRRMARRESGSSVAARREKALQRV